jgi:hypothetical protein
VCSNWEEKKPSTDAQAAQDNRVPKIYETGASRKDSSWR